MTGIILAGGQSRRMGTDKALLSWCGNTLLSVMVDKLVTLCKEILVVGPPRDNIRKVRWVQDHYIGKGPLAGLHAGLEAATFNDVLVLPCDMPMVPLQVLKAIAQLSKEADAVIPVHSKGYEPLCAYYSKSACLPAITDLLESGCFRMLDLLPRLRVSKLKVEEIYSGGCMERVFANLNSPNDYMSILISQNPKPAVKVLPCGGT